MRPWQNVLRCMGMLFLFSGFVGVPLHASEANDTASGAKSNGRTGEQRRAPPLDSVSEVDDSVLTLGKEVYRGKCIACHGSGAAGAPPLSNSSAWAHRLLQGDAVLIQHAIHGYQGRVGYMPAKGGFVNLNERDVEAAVLYMISEVR